MSAKHDAVLVSKEELERLREVNVELKAALTRCLAHFERIRDQQADPRDSPMMAQARAAIDAAMVPYG